MIARFSEWTVKFEVQTKGSRILKWSHKQKDHKPIGTSKSIDGHEDIRCHPSDDSKWRYSQTKHCVVSSNARKITNMAVVISALHWFGLSKIFPKGRSFLVIKFDIFFCVCLAVQKLLPSTGFPTALAALKLNPFHDFENRKSFQWNAVEQRIQR